MKAEFEVQASTEHADGTRQLRLQPVGDPGFRVVEILEHEDGESLGPVVIEFQPVKHQPVPRPGETITLQVRKPRGGGAMRADVAVAA